MMTGEGWLRPLLNNPVVVLGILYAKPPDNIRYGHANGYLRLTAEEAKAGGALASSLQRVARIGEMVGAAMGRGVIQTPLTIFYTGHH